MLRACASVVPISGGTRSWPGPELTISTTVLPRSTSVFGAGSVLITRPAGDIGVDLGADLDDEAVLGGLEQGAAPRLRGR